MYWKFSQPYLLQLKVHDINDQSTVPPIRSPLVKYFHLCTFINQDLLDLKEFEGEGQSQIFQKPTLELKQFPWTDL